MKNWLDTGSLIFIFFSLGFIFSCTEIPPQINPIFDQEECPVVDESVVMPQKRGVLIEEFSGVRCANCPVGSAAIKDLYGQYGDQLVAVSIHTDFFAKPYEDSFYDFRTPEGDGVLNLLKSPIGFPSAVINRTLFNGEVDLQLGLASWAGYIAQEVNSLPEVKIFALPVYNAQTRELSLELSVFPQSDFSGEDLRLSLMLTEDEVVDVQLTPAGKELSFEHNHVLRSMLTNFDGNPLAGELKSGQASCLLFQTTLSDKWDASNCNIVAFVHRGGASKEVLQAVEVKAIP